MKESIDAGTVDRCLRLLAIALPVAALCAFVVFGRLRKGLTLPTAAIGLAGIAGPVLYALWRFYVWMVRYDPKSGYFGLERVWVLLACIAVFVLVGGLFGIAAAKFGSKTKDRKV